MKIETLERILIDTLRTELSSVRTAVQAPVKWIYVDYPRLDAKMPRISLTLTSSVQRAASIGGEYIGSSTLSVMEESEFDIDVWIHRTNKTAGLSPVRAGTALRDYLADQIVDIILKQRQVLCFTYADIIDIEKVGEFPQPYDEDLEIFRKTLTIRITHRRDF